MLWFVKNISFRENIAKRSICINIVFYGMFCKKCHGCKALSSKHAAKERFSFQAIVHHLMDVTDGK